MFGLGAILCEILTGAPPYLEADGDRVGQAARGDTKKACARIDASAASGASEAMIVLCKQCLAPARRARPASAKEVANQVSQHLSSVEERAQQAQVEAAEARVKASEARRAHRLTLGLAASVLVTVLLGGGGWIWLSEQAAARQRQLKDQVDAALAEATLKKGQGKWAEAVAAADRAVALAGSPDATTGLRNKVAADAARVQREFDTWQARREKVARDRAFLDRLDAIRTAEYAAVHTAIVGQDEGPHMAIFELEREAGGSTARLKDRLYREAFAERGIDVDAGSDKGIAQALRSTGMQTELSLTLDHWAMVRAELDDGDRKREKQLLTIALAVDDDPWRRKSRTAMLAGDGTLLADLAEQGEVNASPVTVTVLALALNRAGRRRESLEVLRAAQRRHPGDFGLLSGLGIALGKGEAGVEEGLRYATAALAVRPESAVANLSLGASLWQSGRLHDAIASCRRALELDPKYAFAHFILGRLLERTDKRVEAIVNYRRALEIDPNYVSAHNKLGDALWKQGELQEAVTCFRRLLELVPKSAVAHNNLGVPLSKQGKWDEAIKCFRRAIEIDPKYGPAHSNVGTALSRMGRLVEAIESFRRALEIDPENVRIHSNLGAVLFQQGKLNEAVRSHRRALAIDPQDDVTHVYLGIALKKQGKLDEAIESFRCAIEIDPKHVDAHTNLGLALQAQGKLDGAIASYRRALEVDSKDARAHTNLGRALAGQGKLSEAVRSYRRANEIFSKQNGAFAEKWTRETERRLRKLESRSRLLAIARGEEKANSAKEWASAAYAAYKQARYVTAARAYSQAFAAHPELRDVWPHRYNTACSLALAACGKGKDAKGLSEAARAKLRAQAHGWLVAEFLQLRRQLERGEKLAKAIGRLKHWQKDADLPGIRDADQLKALPAEEAQRWQKFWKEVKGLLVELEGKRSEGKR